MEKNKLDLSELTEDTPETRLKAHLLNEAFDTILKGKDDIYVEQLTEGQLMDEGDMRIIRDFLMRRYDDILSCKLEVSEIERTDDMIDQINAMKEEFVDIAFARALLDAIIKGVKGVHYVFRIYDAGVDEGCYLSGDPSIDIPEARKLLESAKASGFLPNDCFSIEPL